MLQQLTCLASDSGPTPGRTKEGCLPCPTNLTPDATGLAVLGVLLAEPIGPWSEDELIRHMTGGSTDFADHDRITVALGDLVSAGLAHRSNGFYLASRAGLAANAVFGAFT